MIEEVHRWILYHTELDVYAILKIIMREDPKDRYYYLYAEFDVPSYRFEINITTLRYWAENLPPIIYDKVVIVFGGLAVGYDGEKAVDKTLDELANVIKNCIFIKEYKFNDEDDK